MRCSFKQVRCTILSLKRQAISCKPKTFGIGVCSLIDESRCDTELKIVQIEGNERADSIYYDGVGACGAGDAMASDLIAFCVRGID